MTRIGEESEPRPLAPCHVRPALFAVHVRELRRRVRGPAGNRVTLTIVTTLTDPTLYPADDLVALRLRRWDVETNIRHLKTTMGMDVLRCKTPEMVRKEVWAHLLVYNLVRTAMAAGDRLRRQQRPVQRSLHDFTDEGRPRPCAHVTPALLAA